MKLPLLPASALGYKKLRENGYIKWWDHEGNLTLLALAKRSRIFSRHRLADPLYAAGVDEDCCRRCLR